MAEPSSCRQCQAPLGETARFCHRCGHRTASGRHERVVWAAAFITCAVFTAFIAMRAGGMNPAPAPNSAAAAPAATGAAAIDLSSMTPRERFDRLFDRVMAASERGDQAEVTRFSPMAIMAFAQLDAVDQDARFHAGLLHLASGDAAGALAQADSMQARDPEHLLALLIRATVAAQAGDQAESTRARAALEAAWDREIARELPEYVDHRPSLDTFRQSAG